VRKIFLSAALILLSCASLVGITSAAFEEKVSVLGTSFTVGEMGSEPAPVSSNTALKILKNNSGTSDGTNLSDTVNGPAFNDINQTWTQTFPVKLFNKGTKTLTLVSGATYVSDPDTLRDDLFVEILDWNDTNNNGTVENSELGTSHGHDTILRMKNDTFQMGDIELNSVKGYVLRFDGSGLSEANVGKTAVYDFIFTAVEKASQ
jgi:hypothetical protein